jgi:hypothetical protein
MTTYEQGFVEACADLGVEPAGLVKAAQLNVFDPSILQGFRGREDNTRQQELALMAQMLQAAQQNQRPAPKPRVPGLMKLLLAAGLIGGGAYAGYKLAPEGVKDRLLNAWKALRGRSKPDILPDSTPDSTPEPAAPAPAAPAPKTEMKPVAKQVAKPLDTKAVMRQALEGKGGPKSDALIISALQATEDPGSKAVLREMLYRSGNKNNPNKKYTEIEANRAREIGRKATEALNRRKAAIRKRLEKAIKPEDKDINEKVLRELIAAGKPKPAAKPAAKPEAKPEQPKPTQAPGLQTRLVNSVAT